MLHVALARIGEFADDHTGLFMWLVVLPCVLAVVALVLWATGIDINAGPFGNAN